MNNKIQMAEIISLFCRLNMHTKNDYPIRASEMGMLIYLIKTEGVKTPMNVAEFFKVGKAMATNMTSSLSKSGYIVKKVSDEDRRKFLLYPTQKAIDLVNKIYDSYYDEISILENKMGEHDFNEMLKLIEKANKILLEEKQNG